MPWSSTALTEAYRMLRPMRSRISTLILVLGLCIFQSVPALAQSCGDCNLDGSFSILDALAASRIAASLVTPIGAQPQVCDVDYSQIITVLDALRMARASAGLPVSLVCQGTGCLISTPVGSTWSGVVVVDFDIPAGGPAVSVHFEFSTDAGATFASTCTASGSPLPTNPTAPIARGASYFYSWDSDCDGVGRLGVAPVILRITVGTVGNCVSAFSVDNVQPPGPQPLPGDLLITEIMQNPLAIADSLGEWFEVQNLTVHPLDLEGCTIRDNGGNLHVINSGAPLVFMGGARMVLGNNDDRGTNGDVRVDYEYSGFDLDNGDDEVILLNAGGQEVARIVYDGGPSWPDPDGASMFLDAGVTDPFVAQDPFQWCTSLLPWSSGASADLGSPRALNAFCRGMFGFPPWVTPSVAARCQSGDVAIDLQIFDPDSPTIRLTIRASTDQGLTFQLCTPAASSLPPMDQNPAPAVPGLGAATFVWDSAADLPGVSAAVILQVEATDGTGISITETDFILDNLAVNQPPSCVITFPTGGTVPGWDVSVQFNLSDPDSPVVLVDMEFSTDGGATWARACLSLSTPPPIASLPAVVAPGASVNVIWDSLCDAVLPGPVMLRILLDDCANNTSCSTGFTLVAGARPEPQPGELLICEVLQDPAAVSDAAGEWFEIMNIGSRTLDLDGCTIKDDGADSHVISAGRPIPLRAWSRIVLGVNDDPLANGGVTVTYEYSGFTLDNDDDEVVIENPAAVEVVRISYDGGFLWPDPTGASMSLDQSFFDPFLAQDPLYWCVATLPWGPTTDLGTPALDNDFCMFMFGFPPTCLLSGGSTCGSGNISVDVFLDDLDSPALNVTMRFSTDGGASWSPCTPAATSPPPLDMNPANGVPVPAPPYPFIWDSLSDIGATSQRVILQGIAHDGTSGAISELVLIADNLVIDAAPVCALNSPLGVVPAGLVDVSFDLTDADSPGILCTFEHSTDAGLSWRPCTPYRTSPPPYDLNPTIGQAGAGQLFIWCSTCDGASSGAVMVRLMADDCTTGVICSTSCTLTAPVLMPPTTFNQLVFSENLPSPDLGPGGDANGDGISNPLQDEFLELVNITPGPLDLSGVTIADVIGVRHTFPAGTVLPSGRAVVVFSGGTPTGGFGGSVVQTASTGTLDLDDWGDDLFLTGAGGQSLDQDSYWMFVFPPFSIVAMPEPSSASSDPGGRPMQPHGFFPPWLSFSPGTMVDGVTSIW